MRLRLRKLFVVLIAAAASPAGAAPCEGVGIAHAKGDYATELRLLRALAMQGDASAQFNLGLMYGRGQGVPKSLVQAHEWFKLAADQLDADAIKDRDLAASKMTPVQIAEAYIWAWISPYLP